MEYRFPRPPNPTPICNILNKKTVKCLSRLQLAYKKNELNCTKSCPPPCRENLFKLTSSFASWPSDAYQYFYSTRLEEKEIEFTNIENQTSDVRSNVLKLNIFYEELNYEVIREERSYELVNFVSDLGGSLGLWIGMSVLSFAEVLELILLIAFALYVKLRRRLGGRIRSNSEIARKWIFMVYFFHYVYVNSTLFKVIWTTKCEPSDCDSENLSCHSILILIHHLSLTVDKFSALLFSRQTPTSSPNSILASKLDHP